MTPSQKIAEAALRYATGGLAIYDEEPGNCLKAVRELIQQALGIPYGEFYRRYRTEAVDGRPLSEPGQPDFQPWARDVQRSLRSSPYAEQVPWEERGPGMLVFAHDLAEQGHVAVIVARERDVTQVIENSKSKRGRPLSGFNRQSQLELWPTKKYEVFRLIEPNQGEEA